VGRVEDVVTTGDNDEPIFPTKYYNDYIYCDKYGSSCAEALAGAGESCRGPTDGGSGETD
jgi:hypothetical protein